MEEKIYACIDLKSFFASVETVERGLDPMITSLVVADASRGNGAITLAVTPALKIQGVKSRGRLFEIPKHLKYIIAKPRMKLYMQYSAEIYGIYLKYIAAEDIHIYSIDECFIDLTPYIKLYKKTAQDIVKMILEDVFKTKKIIATAGIGTNLFLAKVALDISAKKEKDNIGFLSESLFEKTVIYHRPITDIWGIGQGTSARLEKIGVFDLAGIRSVDEALLYKIFGINAQLLIDHAFGKEPCTIQEIHAYQPESKSISNSQILFEDYNYEDAKIVMKEMVENLVLELIELELKTKHISLGIGYSKDVVNGTHVSKKLSVAQNNYSTIAGEFSFLFDQNVSKNYPIRRISIALGDLGLHNQIQYSLFNDENEKIEETKLLQIVTEIKHKFGKNAILRTTSYLEKATARKRNKLVGGHNGE